jgi:hypothetical protein
MLNLKPFILLVDQELKLAKKKKHFEAYSGQLNIMV